MSLRLSHVGGIVFFRVSFFYMHICVYVWVWVDRYLFLFSCFLFCI